MSLDAVVEPNEEIQLDFAGPLPDEKDKDVYILAGVDRFSRFPSAKVVTNNKADTIIRFMQTHIVNHGVPRNVRCDQAQGFRAKKNLCCTARIITSNLSYLCTSRRSPINRYGRTPNRNIEIKTFSNEN